MHTFLLAILLLGNLGIQQESIQIRDISLLYSFGKQLEITARIQSGDPLDGINAYVYLQPKGGRIYAGLASLKPNGQLTYVFDLAQQPLLPFSTISYWVQIRDGEENVITPSSTFLYADNRFDWLSLQVGQITLHWYSGSHDFGESLKDITYSGAASVNKIIPEVTPITKDIYIYTSMNDISSPLSATGFQSVTGYSFPEQGVALVLAESDASQKFTLQQRIPHELMHLSLFSSHPIGYAKYPVWLVEGLASIVELSPDSEYAKTIRVNSTNNSLVPIESLCSLFPRDHDNLLLAYAESASFTQYLYETYGTAGINNLLSAYDKGAGCSEGTRLAFGLSLLQLDQLWKQRIFPAEKGQIPIGEIQPYLLIAGLILSIPFFIVLLKISKRGN